MILEKKWFFIIFVSSFLARQLPAGVPRVPWWSVPKSFGTLSSGPDSSGDISALRRSWKVFLGSKLVCASSTIRKTKQLMVLATSEKAIPMSPKNHHSAKIIVITASISPIELLKLHRPGLYMLLKKICPQKITKSNVSPQCRGVMRWNFANS